MKIGLGWAKMNILQFPKLRLIKSKDNIIDLSHYHLQELEKLIISKDNEENQMDVDHTLCHLKVLCFLLSDLLLRD